MEVLTAGSRSAFVFRVPSEQDHEVVLHVRPGCDCGCGGGWDEQSARIELHNTLARIQAGVWAPAERSLVASRRASRRRTQTFEQYATTWLQAKINGEIGPGRGIAPRTAALYQSQLRVHLLPFFGHRLIGEIDRDTCLDFKAHKLRQSRELTEALAAGADMRDRRGRRARPLSAISIKKLIDLLAMILSEAVEDRLTTTNAARGRRMQIGITRPRRASLEIDELADLLDAAAELDDQARKPTCRTDHGLTTRLVEQLLAQGKRPHQIAKRLRLARSTVSWHLRRLGVVPGQGYVARHVVCELLGRTGLRVDELCELRVGDLRLNSPTGAHLRVRASKTEAGIREVETSPDLVDAIREHLDRVRAAGLPDGPSAFVVPNTRGGRLDDKRVGKFVAQAVAHASTRRATTGLAPLPEITPHALRRTYVSIALLANGFDVKWVMGQVGHTDSRMTMEVYAQLTRRLRHEHGIAFDRLVREARDTRLSS